MFSFEASGCNAIPCQGVEALGGSVAKLAQDLMRPAVEEVMPAAQAPVAKARRAKVEQTPITAPEPRPVIPLYGLEAMSQPLNTGSTLDWLRLMALQPLRRGRTGRPMDSKAEAKAAAKK